MVAAGKLQMREGTPREYLLRQALSEQVFPTAIQVEGLTADGHFVISQRVIKGGHPTAAAIRKYLLKLGFVNLPARLGQDGGAWFHRDLGVLIMDTAPDNFVAAKQGLVPIDLQIAELDGPLAELAATAEEMLKQAPSAGVRNPTP
jgi:hypothetical protein